MKMLDAVSLDSADLSGVSLAHRQAFLDFFFKVNAEAERKGVSLSYETDFDELLAVNRANVDSWYSLPVPFDPTVNDLSAGWWIKATDSSGRVVATVAGRMVDMGGSLADYLSSLRVLYDDPAGPGPSKGEAIIVSDAVKAVVMPRRIIYFGALWTHPCARALRLPGLIGDLAHAVAATQGAEAGLALATEHPAGSGLYPDYGCRNMVGTILLTGERWHGERLLTPIWRTASEVIEMVESGKFSRVRVRRPD